MTIKQIGIDIGKTTFHVIGIDDDDAIVLRGQFSRSQLIRFCTRRKDETLKVAFEACSGAYWLAHRLVALGHDVKLLTPESVRPFAKAQKNDWNDALAIAEAAQRPGRHAVGIKSEEQLDMQALHRVRQRLMTARTAILMTDPTPGCPRFARRRARPKEAACEARHRRRERSESSFVSTRDSCPRDGWCRPSASPAARCCLGG